MSNRVALRLAGEIVYNPEKGGLHVNVTLAHIEGKIASVKDFRVPWADTDFHNSVKWALKEQMQKMVLELAHKLGDKAPTSYLETPRGPALTRGQARNLACGLPVNDGQPAPNPAEITAQIIAEKPVPLDTPTPPVSRGRPLGRVPASPPA